MWLLTTTTNNPNANQTGFYQVLPSTTTTNYQYIPTGQSTTTVNVQNTTSFSGTPIQGAGGYTLVTNSSQVAGLPPGLAAGTVVLPSVVMSPPV